LSMALMAAACARVDREAASRLRKNVRSFETCDVRDVLGV
jgi:hypothetical protein